MLKAITKIQKTDTGISFYSGSEKVAHFDGLSRQIAVIIHDKLEGDECEILPGVRVSFPEETLRVLKEIAD